MSHSSLDDLESAIILAKAVGIPFMIDTEGAQVRTGVVEGGTVHLPEDAEIELRSQPITGNGEAIPIRPSEVVAQLVEGDLLHIDFDTLILRVSDTSRAVEGVIRARTLTSGTMGSNKAVVVDPVIRRRIELPPLSRRTWRHSTSDCERGSSTSRSPSFVPQPTSTPSENASAAG